MAFRDLDWGEKNHDLHRILKNFFPLSDYLNDKFSP